LLQATSPIDSIKLKNEITSNSVTAIASEILPKIVVENTKVTKPDSEERYYCSCRSDQHKGYVRSSYY
jgi:hypothetical protein